MLMETHAINDITLENGFDCTLFKMFDYLIGDGYKDYRTSIGQNKKDIDRNPLDFKKNLIYRYLHNNEIPKIPKNTYNYITLEFICNATTKCSVDKLMNLQHMLIKQYINEVIDYHMNAFYNDLVKFDCIDKNNNTYKSINNQKFKMYDIDMYWNSFNKTIDKSEIRVSDIKAMRSKPKENKIRNERKPRERNTNKGRNTQPKNSIWKNATYFD